MKYYNLVKFKWKMKISNELKIIINLKYLGSGMEDRVILVLALSHVRSWRVAQVVQLGCLLHRSRDS